MFTHIVVPLDGSYRAAIATRLAMKLARCWQSQVVLLHVAGPSPLAHDTSPPGTGHPHVFVSTQLRTLEAEITRAGIAVRVALRQGAPATAILRVTDALDDALLVMATHGHTGDVTAPLGHVARAILTHARVPTLFVNTRHDLPRTLPRAITAVTALLDGAARDAATVWMGGRFAQALAVPVELLNIVPDARFAALQNACPPEEDFTFLIDEALCESNAVRTAQMRRHQRALAAANVAGDVAVRTAVRLSMTRNPTDAVETYLRDAPTQLAVIHDRDRQGFRRFLRAATLDCALSAMPRALLVVRGCDLDHQDTGTHVGHVGHIGQIPLQVRLLQAERVRVLRCFMVCR